MAVASFKRWVSFAVPDAFLLGAAVVALHVRALHDTLPAAGRLFPNTIFAVGALLAWRLDRGRLFFALAILALSNALLHTTAPGLPAHAAVDLVILLLPLNLAALALRPDRGIFTRAGLTTAVVIAVEAAIVGLVIHGAAPKTATLLEHPFVSGRLLGWLHIPQVGALTFAAALAATALPLVFEANPVGRSFVWAIVASLTAMQDHQSNAASGILLGTAALILVVVTIETSHRLAYQDALTGLPGRRALGEALQQLGNAFALAMVDVDHFKRFNDHYGHDAGDQILKMVATKLSRMGGEGRAYRYGGEEFAIVFAGQREADALPHVEAARRAIADTRFVVRRRLRRKRGAKKPPRSTPVGVSVTISAGLADHSTQHRSPDDVLRAADRALYLAKEGGRNQVRC